MRKRYLFISLAVIIIITGVLVWACKDPTGPGLIERQQDKWDGVNGNNNSYTLTNGQLFISSSYKIPALTVSTNNVIIAAAGVSSGSQKVLIKKSSDYGTNWSDCNIDFDNGYSYPFFINCHNGDILLGITTTTASKDSQTIFYRSKNSGDTWEKENNSININSITNAATNGSATYGQGIALRHGGNQESTKLMFPYLYNAPDIVGKKDGYYVAIMYSENGSSGFKSVCKSFTNILAKNNKQIEGNIGSFGSYHPQLLELANGDILLNIRCLNNKGLMLWLLSKDCGENWDIPTFVDAPENKQGVWAKHADFIRYEFNGKDIKTEYNKYALMICSYENKTGYDIMMTDNDFDNGGTNNKKYASTKNLTSSIKGGYPAITVLKDGTIATLTEENNGIVFGKHYFNNGKLE